VPGRYSGAGCAARRTPRNGSARGGGALKADRIYLEHILDCLEAINKYVAGGRDSFLTDRKTQKATLRELQELAESTQRLSSSLKQRHAEIPWLAIAGFRNVLVHDYLGISLDRVWTIIENDLPPLRAAVQAMYWELD
jgi:uncharacterized protein with HEPN domain